MMAPFFLGSSEDSDKNRAGIARIEQALDT